MNKKWCLLIRDSNLLVLILVIRTKEEIEGKRQRVSKEVSIIIIIIMWLHYHLINTIIIKLIIRNMLEHPVIKDIYKIIVTSIWILY